MVFYLWQLLPAPFSPHILQVICHVHASTCTKCKDEILGEFLDTSGTCPLQIMVVTDVFGCRIDIHDIQQVINFGTPRNHDLGIQHIGWAGWDLDEGKGYMYASGKAWDQVKR